MKYSEFRMTVFDEIEIEDFEYDDDEEMYYYPCPCGDRFEISKVRILIRFRNHICKLLLL